MLSVLNKYLKPKHPEQAKWFAEKILSYVYKDLKSTKDHIKDLKAFYNTEVQNCIIRLKFDERYVFGMENEYLYFLIDYNTKQIERAGRNFDQTISDKDRYINWIKNNKVLAFYPDNTIMHLVNVKING